MNTNNDELERMLGRQLQDQVDGMGGHPLGLGDVKGRAGRIRRNRRIAAGVGVAAAVAIMAPVAIFAAQGLNGADRELDPAPSPDAPLEIARTTLTLDGLERGDAPAVEYFTPDGVVLPGEGLQELDLSYQALVPTSTGWFALGPARDDVVSMSAEFEPRSSSAVNDAFTTTPDRDYVAWTTVGDDGAQTMGVHSTTDAADVTTWEFPEFPVVMPVGILGPDSVVYETVSSQGQTEVGLGNPDGSTTKLPYLRVRSADPVNGLIAVQTKVRLNSGCFAVVEAATREEVWETCDHSLGTFSPGGEYVMATAADSDGLGPSTLDVLDARTGELVAKFSQTTATQIALLQPVWESEDTIATVAIEGETQTMLRLGVDGTLEEIVDPIDEIYGDVFYYLGYDRAAL